MTTDSRSIRDGIETNIAIKNHPNEEMLDIVFTVSFKSQIS